MELTTPAVYRRGSHTTILLEVGRKNLRHLPMTDGELSVKNSDIKEFVREYEEFEYDVCKAAQKYLEVSKYHGITEKARSMLMEICPGVKRSNTVMATAKKDAAPKAVKPKKEEAPAKRGPRGAYEPTMKIQILVEGNPKRGDAAERFKLYKNGISVGKFLENGGRLDDLRFDVKKEFIKVG